MLFTTFLSGLVVVGVVLAQTTPPGFTPAVNKTLDVFYGSTAITPGLLVKKSSVAKQPTIGVTGQTLSGKYLLAMIGESPRHLRFSALETPNSLTQTLMHLEHLVVRSSMPSYRISPLAAPLRMVLPSLPPKPPVPPRTLVLYVSFPFPSPIHSPSFSC